MTQGQLTNLVGFCFFLFCLVLFCFLIGSICVLVCLFVCCLFQGKQGTQSLEEGMLLRIDIHDSHKKWRLGLNRLMCSDSYSPYENRFPNEMFKH